MGQRVWCRYCNYRNDWLLVETQITKVGRWYVYAEVNFREKKFYKDTLHEATAETNYAGKVYVKNKIMMTSESYQKTTQKFKSLSEIDGVLSYLSNKVG